MHRHIRSSLALVAAIASFVVGYGLQAPASIDREATVDGTSLGQAVSRAFPTAEAGFAPRRAQAEG